MSVNVKIKPLSDTVIIPSKAHPDDACYDIYCNAEGVVCIPPHQTAKIPTGFATEIPNGYCAHIYARSGMATKNGMRPAQGTCIIDAGYRGEWFVPIHNDTDVPQSIMYGMRFAQFAIMPVEQVAFTVVAPDEELSSTERGEGGFGSSGYTVAAECVSCTLQ